MLRWVEVQTHTPALAGVVPRIAGDGKPEEQQREERERYAEQECLLCGLRREDVLLYRRGGFRFCLNETFVKKRL